MASDPSMTHPGHVPALHFSAPVCPLYACTLLSDPQTYTVPSPPIAGAEPLGVGPCKEPVTAPLAASMIWFWKYTMPDEDRAEDAVLPLPNDHFKAPVAPSNACHKTISITIET
jgi:hypothetical protein